MEIRHLGRDVPYQDALGIQQKAVDALLRDWYAEGVNHLGAKIRDDGSWVGSESPLQATTFAVLFLSRATRQAVATEKAELTGPVTPEPR